MKRAFIGTAAGLMDSSASPTQCTFEPLLIQAITVPISRAQDEAKTGTGFVRLSPDDPCLVIGVGTKFESELGPRTKIMLPKSVGAVLAEIDQIISDTEVRIKREFSGDRGKGTAKIRQKVDAAIANGEKGLPFKVLPYINQESIYRHVYEQLNNGGCIGIFPEGQPNWRCHSPWFMVLTKLN